MLTWGCMKGTSKLHSCGLLTSSTLPLSDSDFAYDCLKK